MHAAMRHHITLVEIPRGTPSLVQGIVNHWTGGGDGVLFLPVQRQRSRPGRWGRNRTDAAGALAVAVQTPRGLVVHRPSLGQRRSAEYPSLRVDLGRGIADRTLPKGVFGGAVDPDGGAGGGGDVVGQSHAFQDVETTQGFC